MGKAETVHLLSWLSSATGKAGCSRFPTVVHLIKTLSPNSASHASFTASVPAFESPLSLGYLRRTLATNVKLLLFISEDRSPFDAALTGKGFLVGVLATPCCIELVVLLGVVGSDSGGCEHGVVGVKGTVENNGGCDVDVMGG